MCILLRACVTGAALWLALKEKQAVPILGALALVVGIGFSVAYFRGSDTGFFGGEAWWHALRKVHALLWIVTGATMLAGLSWGAVFAVGDTVFGMVAGFMKYGVGQAGSLTSNNIDCSRPTLTQTKSSISNCERASPLTGQLHSCSRSNSVVSSQRVGYGSPPARQSQPVEFSLLHIMLHIILHRSPRKLDCRPFCECARSFVFKSLLNPTAWPLFYAETIAELMVE